MDAKKSLTLLLLNVIIVSTLINSSLSLNAQIQTTPSTAAPLISDTPTATLTPAPTIDVRQYIEVSTTIGTQYPWSKAIPVEVTVKPLIQGQKIELVWEDKSGMKVNSYRKLIQPAVKDQIYTSSFEITPESAGTLRIAVNVILTTEETKYVASEPFMFRVDRSFTVQPESSQYRLYQILQYLLIFILGVVIVPFIFYSLYKYTKNVLIPKWIQKQMDQPR